MEKSALKKHMMDLGKALLAAAAMAMIQVFIEWLSNIHFGDTAPVLNSAAAFTALKFKKS